MGQTDYERLIEQPLGPVWDRLRRAAKKGKVHPMWRVKEVLDRLSREDLGAVIGSDSEYALGYAQALARVREELASLLEDEKPAASAGEVRVDGPLPKADPRRVTVAKARQAVAEALAQHELSYAELFVVLAGELAWWAESARMTEREARGEFDAPADGPNERS